MVPIYEKLTFQALRILVPDFAWMAFTRKRAEGSLHGKAVSQTYRQPSARLRFAGAPISSHCRQIANFDNLVNLVLKRFRRGLNHQFGYAVRDRHPEVSQNLSDFKFPGRGQRETPVANLRGAIEFVRAPSARLWTNTR